MDHQKPPTEFEFDDPKRVVINGVKFQLYGIRQCEKVHKGIALPCIGFEVLLDRRMYDGDELCWVKVTNDIWFEPLTEVFDTAQFEWTVSNQAAEGKANRSKATEPSTNPYTSQALF